MPGRPNGLRAPKHKVALPDLDRGFSGGDRTRESYPAGRVTLRLLGGSVMYDVIKLEIDEPATTQRASPPRQESGQGEAPPA